MECKHELEGPRFRQPKPRRWRHRTMANYDPNPSPQLIWTCKKCDHGFGFSANITVTPVKDEEWKR